MWPCFPCDPCVSRLPVAFLPVTESRVCPGSRCLFFSNFEFAVIPFTVLYCTLQGYERTTWDVAEDPAQHGPQTGATRRREPGPQTWATRRREPGRDWQSCHVPCLANLQSLSMLASSAPSMPIIASHFPRPPEKLISGLRRQRARSQRCPCKWLGRV